MDSIVAQNDGVHCWADPRTRLQRRQSSETTADVANDHGHMCGQCGGVFAPKLCQQGTKQQFRRVVVEHGPLKETSLHLAWTETRLARPLAAQHIYIYNALCTGLVVSNCCSFRDAHTSLFVGAAQKHNMVDVRRLRQR